MSRLPLPLALTLVLAIGGCAALRPEPPADRNAALRLEQGLAALEAGRHAAGYDELAWVAAHCPGQTAALHARAALAALELDPRNPRGRPGVGTRLLADLIVDETTPRWVRAVAEASYLMALGLGAPAPRGAPEAPEQEAAPEPGVPVTPVVGDPDVAVEPVADPVPEGTVVTARGGPVRGCGATLREVVVADLELPSLPGPSMAAMLAGVRSERDAQALRAAALDAEVETLRQELEATQAELDRIRRTLRP